MGLITLAFLLAFTVLYLSKSLEKKPEFVTKAAETVNANVSKLSVWGAGYGLVAAFLTLIMAYSGGDMLVRLFANIVIVLMALPFAFEQLLPKFQEKLNPAIIEEVKKMIGILTKQDKYVGYAGAVGALLLFAVVFR